MLLVWLIFLVIRDSHGREECGKILTSVNYATEGAGDWIAPWVVSLGVYEGGEYKVQCTGSLVTPDTLVTAAHCFVEKFRGLWAVRAGVKDQRFRGAVETSIKRISLHPEYSSPRVYYDVAVAVLNESLPMRDSISTLCLPDSPYDVTTMDGDGVTVQGWGRDNDGVIGQTLTEIGVTVRSRAECNYKYQSVKSHVKSFYFPELMTEAMFCADNNLNTDVGTCYGDSGGPVIRRNWDREEGEVFTLVGVVSGNPDGCDKFRDYPDYYTFLGHKKILKWIMEEIRHKLDERQVKPTNRGKSNC